MVIVFFSAVKHISFVSIRARVGRMLRLFGGKCWKALWSGGEVKEGMNSIQYFLFGSHHDTVGSTIGVVSQNNFAQSHTTSQ
jgi:hypothetical protein